NVVPALPIPPLNQIEAKECSSVHECGIVDSLFRQQSAKCRDKRKRRAVEKQEQHKEEPDVLEHPSSVVESDQTERQEKLPDKKPRGGRQSGAERKLNDGDKMQTCRSADENSRARGKTYGRRRWRRGYAIHGMWHEFLRALCDG